MNSITEKLRALNNDKRGQIGTGLAATFLGLMVSLIVIAVVALVVDNVLTIANLTTDLWTLDSLLLSVIFVLTMIAAMIIVISGAVR